MPTPTPTLTPTNTATPTFTPIPSGLPEQKLFVLSEKLVNISQYSTNKTNVLSNIVFDGITFDLSNQCVRPLGIFTTEVGTLFFVLDDNVNGGTGTVYKYSLTAMITLIRLLGAILIVRTRVRGLNLPTGG